MEPYGRKDGVGLGLTIAKGYIELLGGSIKAESTIGEGSVFTVNFPLIISDEKSNNLV